MAGGPWRAVLPLQAQGAELGSMGQMAKPKAPEEPWWVVSAQQAMLA